MNKSVSWTLGLLMAAIPVAAQGSMDIFGQKGVHRTQSAQTLGHGRMGIGVLADYSTDPSVFQDNSDGTFRNYPSTPGQSERGASISEYQAGSIYPFLSLGLSDYFDFGISLPVYFDKIGYDQSPCPDNTCSTFPDDMSRSGYGDLRINTKVRLPIDQEQYIIDLAILLGGTVGVSNIEKNGPWIREPEYVNVNTGKATAYGNANNSWKAGAAATLDFNRLEDAFPLKVHANYSYRAPLNENYTKVHSVSAAAELTPKPFVTLFAEYFQDIPTDFGKLGENGATRANTSLDLQSLTAGGIVHTPIGVDFYLGLHAYLGGSKYIDSLYSYDEGGDRRIVYGGRVNPAYSAYGGIVWTGFLIPQDADDDGIVDSKDKCPDKAGPRENDGCPWGNPDVDEDGVCDAWVSEKGLEEQYAEVCEGIDVCPNEEGELEDNGCPVAEPDQDEDGVCDPWVSEKKMLKRFKDVCSGYDKCPSLEGDEENEGCPMGNPDMDKDSVCDPWVSEKGMLDKYAEVCKGYDKCPNEAGAIFNDGCKLDDPDIDGDGVCDAWVTEKKMGFHFKEKCTGTDQCPHDPGRLEDNGCPLGDPDMDKDSICDPWVSQKGQLSKFVDVCKGYDKCPSDSGSVFNEGCPLGDPDMDKDSVCDSWVTEKKLNDVFKGVCVGLDKCPLEVGVVENEGCPAVNPDLDGDGFCDSWVAEKGQLAKFADKCKGIDKCPNQAGVEAFEGCPAPKIEAKVNLKGVNFMTGKAELTLDAKRVLDGVAEQLLASPDVNIEIHGHTDSKGNPKSNLKLSEQRAQSVVNYLATKGVKLSRMKAKGWGADMPIADNKTESGREQNRRIEMLRAD